MYSKEKESNKEHIRDYKQLNHPSRHDMSIMDSWTQAKKSNFIHIQ